MYAMGGTRVCCSGKIINGPVITYDAEGGCEGLDAAQLARLAIVHRICRHQIRQQPRVRAYHLTEGRVLEPRPRAVDHCNSALSHDLPDRQRSV